MTNEIGSVLGKPETSGADEVSDALAAWRACGADRVNPARFRFIDALARRAAGHEGDVRRVLDERLAALIADYSEEVRRAKVDAAGAKAGADANADFKVNAVADAATQGSEPASGEPMRDASQRSSLAELVELLTSRAASATAATERNATATRDPRHPGTAHPLDASPDLPLLDYFRETWSKFSTEKELRHSLEQVPDKAGPLNSNSLVHRSLALMRELSPGYLQQFLSYIEALSWMEQLAGPIAGTGASAAPLADVTRTSGTKKNTRGKGR